MKTLCTICLVLTTTTLVAAGPECVRQRLAEQRRVIDAAKARIAARRGLDQRRAGDYAQPGPVWLQWWREQVPEGVESAPLGFSTCRAIAEVRTPWTDVQAVNQQAELAHFWSLGYNAALLVWHGEPADALATLAANLHAKHLTVLLALGLGERCGLTPYRNPQQLRAGLRKLVPHADAFLPCWRGSSQSHWTHDADFALRYASGIARMAREINPGIPVIGELFLGHCGVSRATIVPGSAAVLVLNVGHDGVRPDIILRRVRRETELPAIVLIVGPYPYWRTVGKRGKGLQPAEVASTWVRLEKRFTAAGFVGSITLAGDGFGSRLYDGEFVSDSLTESKWRSEK